MQSIRSVTTVLHSLRDRIRRRSGSPTYLHHGYGRAEFVSHYLYGWPFSSGQVSANELWTFHRSLGGRHAGRRNRRIKRKILDRHTRNSPHRKAEVHRTLYSDGHEHAAISSDDR